MRARLLLFSAILPIPVRVAAAQRPDIRIAASAGSATDVTGIVSRAVTLATSVTLQPTPTLALGIAGGATRYDAGAWSASLGGSLDARAQSGPAALTLGAGLDYTSSSYGLAFVTATAFPAVEAQLGPMTAFGGLRFDRALRSAFVSQRPVTPLPPALGRTDRGWSARSAARAVYGTSLRGSTPSGEYYQLGVREERGTVGDSALVDRHLGATLVMGAMAIAGSVGVRQVRASRTPFGTASAAFALSEQVALELAGGRYASNPLTGVAIGRFISAGVSLRFARATPSLPRPAGVASPARGLTRLSISAPDAGRVEIAGDFNRWTPIAARRAPNGVWFIDLRIPAGEYRYAFRIDGQAWRIPDGVPAADDGFGGKAAWLTVTSPSAGHVVP